jgi:hypothetical protein
MYRGRLFRTGLAILCTLGFAAADAAIKGHHGGTRNAVGDISATWALLPFLAGTFLTGRRVTFTGACVGAASTAMALVTYSLVRGRLFSQVDDQHSALILMLTNRWLLIGIVGGGALGAAGARLAVRGARNAVAVVAASLLAMEPLARVFWAVSRGESARTLLPSPSVWVIEVGCGCAIVLALCLRKLVFSRSR